jgi:hypothetical protein
VAQCEEVVDRGPADRGLEVRAVVLREVLALDEELDGQAVELVDEPTVLVGAAEVEDVRNAPLGQAVEPGARRAKVFRASNPSRRLS